jgi:hypothetical protein
MNEDKTFNYKKPVYFTVQNVTAIFDYSLEPIENFSYQANSSRSLSVYGIENKSSGGRLIALWFDDQKPSEKNEFKNIDFTFYQSNFENPVYVDLRPGIIYELTKKNWHKNGSRMEFKNIPVYDSPILIAEKGLLQIKSDK